MKHWCERGYDYRKERSDGYIASLRSHWILQSGVYMIAMSSEAGVPTSKVWFGADRKFRLHCSTSLHASGFWENPVKVGLCRLEEISSYQ